MFRRLVMAACAILATGVLVTAEAHRRHHRWYGGGGSGGGDTLVVISEQDVDMSLDRFTVDVSSAKGAYKGVRVRSQRGHFELSKVQVVYNDGSVHNEDRHINLLNGERSRPINPTADSYFVDQVTVEQQPTSGRGRLQILGIQGPEGRDVIRQGKGRGTGPAATAPSSSSSTTGPARGSTAADPALSGNIAVKPTVDQPSKATPGQVTEGGDVLFGAQYVGFINDRDFIRVGNEIGKFDRIRLRVLDNDIHITELKVVYANGETDTLAVNANIPKNSRTNSRH